MKLNKLALIVALAALVCSAIAQGGGGGRQGRGQGNRGNQFAPMTIAGREEVQKEIGLTDDQKTKITELRTATQQKSRDARQAANGDRQAQQEAMTKINAEAAKALAEILKPEQLKRLRELQIQWTGSMIVVSDKEVQKELAITEEQTAKFKELQDKQRAAMQEAQQNANGDRAAITEAMTKNAKIMEEEIGKVLTDAQKTKLKEMGGKEMPKPAPAARGGGRAGGGF